MAGAASVNHLGRNRYTAPYQERKEIPESVTTKKYAALIVIIIFGIYLKRKVMLLYAACMIRMIQSQSAKQAKSYFNDALSKSDYYLNDQELPGTFHGKIAKRIGLSKEATRDAFRMLCDNINPSTGKRFTPRNRKDRTVGYDINFHVPKSVSVLNVLSKDAHILNAFRESVRDTMLDIEKDAKTGIRKQKQSENRSTGELLWGEFVHQTARPVKNMVPDPHLHAHCFVFNVTWDKVEHRYKAGQFRDMKRDMPFYQAMFHKRLSDKLISLGYSVRQTKTSFEVVGVPQPVIDLFSKRTNEIGQLAKTLNITDAKGKDTLGARSRAKKQKGLTFAELKKDWRKQIAENGLQDDDGSGTPIRHAVKDPDLTTPENCVDHSLDHHFERVSVKQDRRLLETAYRYAIGKENVSVANITKRFKADKRIIKIKDGDRVVCTTKEALAEEKRMVALAQKGKGAIRPLYLHAPDILLDGEQREAVRHVLTTSARVSIISGKAGTGKTTLMKEADRLIKQAGKKVIVVAPTANASRGVLRDEGFKDAETVAKLLTDKSLQSKLRGQVLWVDEAGLLGTKDMTALLQLAKDRGAQLILSGDTRQHSSVVRGDALRILNTVAGIKSAHVNRIYRQKNEIYKQAVESLSKGDLTGGFANLDKMDAIRETDRTKLADRLALDYVTTLQKGKTVLAVSPTHEQGQQVTTAIRNRLKQNNLLGSQDKSFERLVNLNLTDAEKSDANKYPLGSVIQFNQNRHKIKRGSRWAVVDVNGSNLTIQNDKGEYNSFCLEKKKNDFDAFRSMEIGLAEGDVLVMTRNGMDADKKRLNNGQVLRVVSFDDKNHIVVRNDISKATYKLPVDHGHINHAYCVTSHASQGQTVDQVLIAQPSPTFAASNLKQFYVSVSRGREAAHIYTDDRQALMNQVGNVGDRVSATELVARKKSRAHDYRP